MYHAHWGLCPFDEDKQDQLTEQYSLVLQYMNKETMIPYHHRPQFLIAHSTKINNISS